MVVVLLLQAGIREGLMEIAVAGGRIYNQRGSSSPNAADCSTPKGSVPTGSSANSQAPSMNQTVVRGCSLHSRRGFLVCLLPASVGGRFNNLPAAPLDSYVCISALKKC